MSLSLFSRPTVLVIEDGNEYVESLERFVPGPRYVQARGAGPAIAVLRQGGVDLVYLDMRFDRIAHEELVGDYAQATREHNGDPRRAWTFLANHQGLFILAALRQAGFGATPVLLAYDFAREPQRWARIHEGHPRVAWVRDGATAEEILALMRQALAR